MFFFLGNRKNIFFEKSLKLENAKNKTSFIFIKSFAVERGPKHFFGNHENDGTREFYLSKDYFLKKFIEKDSERSLDFK